MKKLKDLLFPYIIDKKYAHTRFTNTGSYVSKYATDNSNRFCKLQKQPSKNIKKYTIYDNFIELQVDTAKGANISNSFLDI